MKKTVFLAATSQILCQSIQQSQEQLVKINCSSL